MSKVDNLKEVIEKQTTEQLTHFEKLHNEGTIDLKNYSKSVYTTLELRDTLLDLIENEAEDNMISNLLCCDSILKGLQDNFDQCKGLDVGIFVTVVDTFIKDLEDKS